MFGFWLECKCWNNALDREKRKQLGSDCKLWVPEIKKIALKDLYKNLILWDKIVFEVVENKKLLSKIGLKNYLEFDIWNTKFAIFDNHNIALYFLWKYFFETREKLDLIHIDQHSDLRKPDFMVEKLNTEKTLIDYTLKWVNVWNYLLPAQKFFINQIYQVRVEPKLFELTKDFVKWKILNIDLDFWAPEMGTSLESLKYLKELLFEAKLVLIATSPYFLEQNRAVELVKKLLTI